MGLEVGGEPFVGAKSSAKTNRNEWPVLILIAALGMTSVVPLLAWVSDLSDFQTVLLWVAVPGSLTLVALSFLSQRGERWPSVYTTLRLGVVAGVIGAVAYDLFRVPFLIVTRFGLLRPIESYGVLALNASESSTITAFAGWSYHFSNGIGFAIVYMALFRGRHWGWAVAWAMLLESGAVFSPFAQDYGLWNNPTAIVIAYGAHVPYALALGIIAQNSIKWDGYLDEAGRYVVPGVLAAVVITLALWLRPGTSSATWEQGEAVDDGPSAVISNAVFSPLWLRTDSCVVLRNTDNIPYTFTTAVDSPIISPGTTATICFATDGVLRINPTGEPDDGGFVIVDKFATGGQS